MRSHPTLIVLVIAILAGTSATTAEQPQATPIATWSLGQGTLVTIAANAFATTTAATPGSDIALGQRIASGSAQPAKIVFAAPLAGSVTLAPGSVVIMREEVVAEAKELVIDLDQGAVQVDVLGRGPYAGVRVRGAVLDVRVTGTLFVVQRVTRDADYVALVQGRLKAGLRTEVADVLGKGQQFEIKSRQGIGASTAGGLEQIAALTNRPQIVSLKTSIKNQGTAPQQGDGGWDTDLALDLLNDLFDQVGFADALMSELTDALGEALFDDLQAGPGDQVINSVFASGTPGALGSPPPPPVPQ